MDVGDHGDLQRKVRGPLPRRRMIAGDAKPQDRLDAAAIGRGRYAEGGQAADGTEEMTARDHGSPIVMRLLDAILLERKWGGFVQTLCTRSPEIHDGASSLQLRRSVVALVGAEQADLCRRIARGLADAEMAEGVRGEQAAARGPLQIATLDQIRLDDVFDRIARLRQSGGHRLDADRTAAIVLRDGREVTAVHGIEAGGVNLERAQRVVGNLAIDPVGIGRRSKIAHAAEQPAGDTWRATGAARDFVGAVRAHANVEHAGATGDDALKLFDRVEIEPDRNAETIT